MDLNLVTAFVRVVEAQSFTSAARTLGLPKSSVSRRVSELEEALGVQLLHRTTRKLALTEAGRSYFAQAERAIAELDAAAEAASGMDTEPRGVVRVTAPVDIGVMGLAELLAEFSKLYPEIHIELSLNSRVVNLVDDGFDLGVRAGKSQDASLVTRRIGNADLGLYASREYLDRCGRPKALSDLAQHDCVLFRAQQGKTTWQLEGPHEQVSSVEVRGPISADEMLFVRQAISAGMGIGLLPRILVTSCDRVSPLPPIERVLSDYSLRGAELTVLTASGVKRPRRVTLLRDFLVTKLTSRCQAHGLIGSAAPMLVGPS